MAAISLIANGLCKPEGPICLEDGSWVVTEMGAGCLTWINENGSLRRRIAVTGRPNGIALDCDGALWVAESRFPSLLRVSLNGEVDEVSVGSDELDFLWPNDLCIGPDGALYITDSGVLLNDFEGKGLPSEKRAKKIDGRIFRFDIENGRCECLTRGLRFANGIAFDASNAFVYVSETLTGNIYRYRFYGSGGLGSRELFANVMSRPISEWDKIAGPDGMAFDENGMLYVCVLEQGDVTIVDPNGDILERVPLVGNFPTNIAFGGGDRSFAIVTEVQRGELLKIQVGARGLPLNRTAESTNT